MTVIRPNSVSGINSITAQADEIKVFKSNGTQGGLIIGGANLNATTGISTLLALNVTGNVSIAGTLTYQDVTNVDSLGIGTFRTGINVSGGQLDVGSNIKIGNAGVITATSFSGSGANLTGISQVGGSTGVDFTDNVKARFGTGNDLEIYHNANHSIIHDNGTGDLKLIGDDIIIQANNDDTMAKFIEDGAVELYHNNEKMFSTNNDGAEFFDSDNNFNLYFNCNGTRRGYIFVDATGGGQISLMDSQDHPMLQATKNGAVELYHDNTKMLSTESRGAIIQKSGSANLIIGSTNGGGANLFLDGASNGDGGGGDYCGVRGTSSGHLTLFADNPSQNGVIYFQTGNSTDRWFMESGGHFKPNNNNAYDIGSTALRVRNIYTNDLHLSNEGSTNRVDNTWGNYTIQEGESDLFLINNRNGKKYKFNLTEVN